MGISLADKILYYVPEIKHPLRKIPLRERIRNTFIILISYIMLMNAKLPTINPSWLERYKLLQFLYGTKFGSVITLGTSPIVIAGLLMEILVFGKMINLDLEKVEDRDRMMKYQKLATVGLIFWFGIVYAIRMANPTLIDVTVTAIVFIFGGFLVYFMDDYISKYGFGSGISWFIFISVASSVVAGFFDPTKDPVGRFNGYVWKIVDYFFKMGNGKAVDLYGDPGSFTLMVILPVLGTIAMIYLIAWLEGTEIVLAPSRLVRIDNRRMARLPAFKLKLTYLSVMPIIFGVFTIEFITSILLPFKGHSVWIDRLINDLYMPYGYLSWNNWEHWLVYGSVFTFFGVLFSLWFSKATGLSVETVDDTLKYYYQDFRRATPIGLKKAKIVMKALPLVSSLIVIALSLLGDFIGIIGSGSGLLLLVSIAFNFRDLWKAELNESNYLATKDALVDAFKDTSLEDVVKILVR